MTINEDDTGSLNPLRQLVLDMRAEHAAWEKQVFGDDEEAKAAHYAYCLQVMQGTEGSDANH